MKWFLPPVSGGHGTGVLHWYTWSLKWFLSPALLMCLMLIPHVKASAQTTLLYTIHYVADRTTQYVYPDSLQSYFIHEQIALMPVHQRDSVIRMVYTNKDVKNITYYKEDSRFEDWMNRPAKSIIDKKSVKLYNSSGALMLNQLHTNDYKTLYSGLKTQMTTLSADLIPDYVQLTTALKTSMIANGFVMTNLGGGTYRFVKDSVEVRYNNSRKMNELRLYHTDGSLKYTLLRDFSVNSYGQTTPVLTQERRPDTRFPGNCVEEIVTTKYPEYYMVYGGTGRLEDEEEPEAEITLAPNPVSDATTVYFPPASQLNATASIEVYDITGKIIFQDNPDAASGMYILQTNTFSPGIYTVRYTCENLKLETQLIKQH